jgi:hypothetical protein
MKLIPFSLSLLFIPLAHADIVTVPIFSPFTSGDGNTGGGEGVFPAFDTSLGALNSATAIWSLTVHSQLFYDSLINAPAPSIADFSETLVGTVGGSPFQTPAFSFDGPVYVPKGCQCWFPISGVANGTVSVTPGATDVTFGYSIPVTIHSDNQVFLETMGSVPATISFTGSVNYDYTPVPEPSTAWACFTVLAVICAFQTCSGPQYFKDPSLEAYEQCR